MMKGSGLWELRAPLSARTPDTEPLWQAASRISPLSMRTGGYRLLCVSVCVGRRRAHPRGAAEHLLGPAPAHPPADVRRQRKVPSQQVGQLRVTVSIGHSSARKEGGNLEIK